MNPVSIDVSDKLVADGVGTFKATTGWSINISSEPIKPATTITIYDSGGPPPEGYQNRALKPLKSDSVQIRVRADGYETAYDKIKSVNDIIIGWGRFTVEDAASAILDVNYKGIFPMTGIMFLEKNDSAQYIWVVNFRAQREEQA